MRLLNWFASAHPRQEPACETNFEEAWLEPWVPQEGRVFVDVGANEGSWTKWLADSYEWIHAVEPNPAALPELMSNLASNVIVHEVAAWNCEGVLRFTRFENSVHLSSYFEQEGINTGPPVGDLELPCRRIDSLEIEGQIDFVKIDIEGAEFECLLGAEKLIKRDKPWLIIEIHSAENFKRIVQLLSAWNYLFTVVRHPLYSPYCRLWYEHCWLSCQFDVGKEAHLESEAVVSRSNS